VTLLMTAAWRSGARDPQVRIEQSCGAFLFLGNCAA
jgi:hypothetical protein